MYVLGVELRLVAELGRTDTPAHAMNDAAQLQQDMRTLQQCERILHFLCAKEDAEVEQCVLGVLIMSQDMDAKQAAMLFRALAASKAGLPLMWRLQQARRLLALTVSIHSEPMKLVHVASKVSALEADVAAVKADVAALGTKLDAILDAIRGGGAGGHAAAEGGDGRERRAP